MWNNEWQFGYEMLLNGGNLLVYMNGAEPIALWNYKTRYENVHL